MFLQVPLDFTSQQFCWHLLPNLHKHVRVYTTAIWKVFYRRAHLEVNRWIQNAIHKLVLSKEFVEQLWREADDLPRRTRSYAPGFGWVQRERKSIINIILRQIAAGSKAMPSIRFNQNMSKLFHQNSTHMCCTWGACAVIIPYRVPKLCIRTGQRWRVVFGLHRRHCSELLRPQRPRLG